LGRAVATGLLLLQVTLLWKCLNSQKQAELAEVELNRLLILRVPKANEDSGTEKTIVGGSCGTAEPMNIYAKSRKDKLYRIKALSSFHKGKMHIGLKMEKGG